MKFFKKKPLEKKQSAAGASYSIHNVGQPAWTARNLKAYAAEGYERNVVVHRCVTLISKGIASLKPELYNSKDERIEQHDLLRLLRSPNTLQSGPEWFEGIAAFKLITGNAYIEAAYPNQDLTPSLRPPTYLYNIEPTNMVVIKGSKGQPKGYRFEESGQQITFPMTNSGVSNILHIKSFHPTNHWYGLSNMEAAAYAVDQHNEAGAWNQALLQNSARPCGALMVDGDEPLEEQQKNNIKAELDLKYSGSNNSGRPMVMDGKLSWQEMSLSPKDMDFLSGKDSVARDIAMGFGVPSQLLGIPGDSTYANMQEARLSLWEQTILPLAEEIYRALNNWLVPRFGTDLYLTFDKEGIDALRFKREKQRESLEKSTFITINEKREIMGMEPIEGGDELLVESSRVPLGLVNEMGDLKQDVSKSMFSQTLKSLGFDEAEIKDFEGHQEKKGCDHG